MPESLAAQIARQRAEVARHKAAMRWHRDQLGVAKAALVALEDAHAQECRRRGIDVIVVPVAGTTPNGEGVLHGRDLDSSHSRSHD